MTRRVVITGMGTINSLASDLRGFNEALCAGRSGVGLIEQFDTSAFKVKFGGEVKNFAPEAVVDARVNLVLGDRLFGTPGHEQGGA